MDGMNEKLPEIITLRDWFAGMALTTLSPMPFCESCIAEIAYQIADAMLKEREK